MLPRSLRKEACVPQGSVSVMGSKWMKEAWLKYRDNLPPAPDGAKTPSAEQTWK